MKVVRVVSPDNFFATIDEIFKRDAVQEIYVVFFGSSDPENGQMESWCSDCVIADPVIRRKILSIDPPATLVECPVGLQSEWKGNSKHLYRVHGQLGITNIPTLIKWKSTGPCDLRLVEDACLREEKLNALIAS